MISFGLCRACKYWEGNAELLLNGPEGILRNFRGACYNEETRGCISVWETKLPDYIKPNIRNSFVTKYDFGCANWEEAEGWEALWS